MMQLSGELGLPNNKVVENASGCGGVFYCPPADSMAYTRMFTSTTTKSSHRASKGRCFPLPSSHLLPSFVVTTISGYKPFYELLCPNRIKSYPRENLHEREQGQIVEERTFLYKIRGMGRKGKNFGKRC